MALLKKNAPPVAPVVEPVVEPEVAAATAKAEEAAAAEEAEVEIDNMDEAEIGALVAEHGIAVPANWKKLDLGEKKAWLNAQFGADNTEAKVRRAIRALPRQPPRWP
jgi:hypothetical protein